MCLSIIGPMKVAEEDIIVFKIGWSVGDEFAPYYESQFRYKKDVRQPEVELVETSQGNIEQGYHSFIKEDDAKFFSLSRSSVVERFYIPKGTKYYKGVFDYSYESIASATIVWGEPVQKPALEVA